MKHIRVLLHFPLFFFLGNTKAAQDSGKQAPRTRNWVLRSFLKTQKQKSINNKQQSNNTISTLELLSAAKKKHTGICKRNIFLGHTERCCEGSIVLAAQGAAAEKWPRYVGEYSRTRDQHNGSPVYRIELQT